ncbi:hypothetical protein CH259_16255 [Rhodococcus sp. 05-2254-4]|nr:hypothetical protein CH259_16255 [Rhodococcus sp. 05-2254-4]OZE48009.1 hypothetical protein CH261_08850 [Rhodococcus sp. 05-2254-3]OZE49220.1 hypothetical protein CH283_16635 [Rhodococcus sp. 05-2254-2]
MVSLRISARSPDLPSAAVEATITAFGGHGRRVHDRAALDAGVGAVVTVFRAAYLRPDEYLPRPEHVPCGATLRGWFGPSVADPVQLHDASRT